MLRGSPAGKQWTRDETWNVIDRYKEQKEKVLGMEEVPEKKKETYESLIKEFKKKCRKDNEAWHEVQALKAEQAARRNDTRTIYKVVNTLTNKINGNTELPVKSKNGDVLRNPEDQAKRWVEHFKKILNQEDLEEELIIVEEKCM